MGAVVLHLDVLHDEEREMNEDEGRLPFRKLGFAPVELFFAERSLGFVVYRASRVPGVADEVIQVDEFPAFVID